MLLAAVRPSDQPYFRLAFRSFPCLCSFHFLKKPKTVQKSTIENHQTSNTPLDLPLGFSSCTRRGATPFQFVPQDLLNLRAFKMQDLHEKKIVLVGSTPYSKILEDLRGQNLFLINYFKRFLYSTIFATKLGISETSRTGVVNHASEGPPVGTLGDRWKVILSYLFLG